MVFNLITKLVPYCIGNLEKTNGKEKTSAVPYCIRNLEIRLLWHEIDDLFHHLRMPPVLKKLHQLQFFLLKKPFQWKYKNIIRTEINNAFLCLCIFLYYFNMHLMIHSSKVIYERRSDKIDS